MLLNSLAVKSLWKMSLRIAMIIFFVTGAGYFYLSHSIETQTKETILRYTKEREARERISFDLARQNHSTLSSEFLREYRRLMKDPKLESQYNALVKKYSDGLIRNRDAGFDGTKLPGVFIGKPENVNRSAMAKVVASYDICDRFGLGYHHLFQDTYFTFLDINSIVIYWPEQPRWVQNAGTDLHLDAEEYSSVSSPANDPHRATVWTGLFYDKVSRIWMVTASTPIYDGDVFLGSVHHDLMVTELIERTLNDHLAEARNFIVRRDGRLIAHDDHFEDIKRYSGNYDIRAGSDEKLMDQFRLISETPSGDVATDDHDNYLAVVQIPGPDWWLVTEYPRSIVRAQAMNSAGFLFGGGVLSLLLVIFVLYSVLRREVSLPLLNLMKLTDRIAGGEYGIKHDQKSKDELGMLGKSINQMSEVIMQRDQALARHNSDLESLIQERNKELDEQKALNLHGSKMSALGEMAGSVGQEMNGPLESIVAMTTEIENNLNRPQPDLVKAKEGLKNINQVTERVSKIVASLKMFTRNASSDPFNEANLQTIMKEVNSSYADRCRRKGIELTAGIADKPIKIQCRADELAQAILNVMANACDAVALLPEKWINVQVIDYSGHVEIRITDSGHGIPTELQKKIFQPFFTTKRLGHGGGVGLSISAGIIKSHGGRLGIDNSSSNTCFVISLPKSDSRPIAQA